MYGDGDGLPEVSGRDPTKVRASLGIQPGQKVQVIRYDDRIELIPVRPVRETCGFLEDIDTEVDRV